MRIGQQLERSWLGRLISFCSISPQHWLYSQQLHRPRAESPVFLGPVQCWFSEVLESSGHVGGVQELWPGFCGYRPYFLFDLLAIFTKFLEARSPLPPALCSPLLCLPHPRGPHCKKMALQCRPAGTSTLGNAVLAICA